MKTTNSKHPLGTPSPHLLNRRFVAGLVSTVVLCSEAFAALQNAYTFTTLDVPGAEKTTAAAINNAGEIVGSYVDDAGFSHGFSYLGGIFTTIDMPGFPNSFLNGVNDAGQIAGWYGNDISQGPFHGFLYADGVFTNIDVPGADMTRPFGINLAGQIVGEFTDHVGLGFHSFLYQDGIYSTIAVPGSASCSCGDVAIDINDSGEIVGFFDTDTTPLYNGYLDIGGAFTTIDFPGADETSPYGINESGAIAGEIYLSDTGTRQSFVYVAGIFSQMLVPGSAMYDGAGGINAGGQIVGYFRDATGRFHGYLANPTCDTAPIFTNCPGNLVVTTGPGRATCDQVATWTPPIIASSCSPATLTSDHNPGDTFPVGTTTVTYTATDAAERSTTCSFTITVADTTPPSVGPCPDVTVNATSPAGAVVPLAPPASDNCSPPNVTTVPPSGSAFPIGTNQVICTATDSSGNSNSCGFNVIVLGPEDQITALINLVKTFNLTQGIQNSLDKKLQNAETALDSAKSGSLTSTCGMLGAFINEVAAQLSGNEINSSQAQQLTTAARNIEAVIGCP